MAKRELSSINAGSMADIAFLLLIFFLVATTMDIDTGILRKLPPMPPADFKPENNRIKERNLFIVLINKSDKLQVEGQPMDVSQLREKAKEFIANPYDNENLPEKTEIDVPFFGTYRVTQKHVISLQNDIGTSYEMYLKVQNELIAAYNELRDEIALQRFGVRYDELEEDQQEAIQQIYRLGLSEAEPKKYGEQN